MPVVKPRHENIAELLHELGDIPPDRVRLDPLPGTATKRDLLRVHDRHRLCELIDGTLVEKAMGTPESYIAIEVAFALRVYLTKHDIGYVYGADGLVQVRPHRVRAGCEFHLVVEATGSHGAVHSDHRPRPRLGRRSVEPLEHVPRNRCKLEDYFRSGVRLVWIIDPKSRTAEIHSGPDEVEPIDEAGSLDGRDVLPGFTISLAKLFERLEKPKGRKKR